MISTLEKDKVEKEDRNWEGIAILDKEAKKSLTKNVHTVLKKVREQVEAVSKRTFQTGYNQREAPVQKYAWYT